MLLKLNSKQKVLQSTEIDFTLVLYLYATIDSLVSFLL